MSGSRRTSGIPGTNPRPQPPSTSRIGYGTSIRSETTISARTAPRIRRTTSSVLIHVQFSRREPASDVEAWLSNVRYRSNNRMRNLHHPRMDEIALPDVLHALSDPVRLQIVRALGNGGGKWCRPVEGMGPK